MTINIISCVANYNDQLAIGKNGSLLFNLRQDLKMFKDITTNKIDKNSRLDKNVVLMGRKTWFSIDRKFRPLKGRLNLILTKDQELLKMSRFDLENPVFDHVYFITWFQFLEFYKITNANVFVIGGSDIYDLFLKTTIPELIPSKIYITKVDDHLFDLKPDTFMTNFSEKYKLVSLSEKKHENNTFFRFLEYKYDPNFKSQEHLYLNALKNVLNNGSEKIDRTGTGTLSIFGHQIQYDISQFVPLLTTKKVPWKTVIEELLWFCRGDTDVKILQKKGIKIWDGNTSREFLDKQGLYNYQEGILGPGYGWQWRHFGAEYSQAFADTSLCDTSKIGGFDQLKHIEDLLKNDPFSRRIVLSAWNPPDFSKTALVPCHMFLQFSVEKKGSDNILNCMFTMRSNDIFLGNPFNIFSYTVLTYILAKKCNMIPGKLIISVGDLHLYKNHLEPAFKQLTRTPRPSPILSINDIVKDLDWKDLTIDMFEIIGYMPHPMIKAPMAI